MANEIELTPGIIACRDFFKNIEDMYARYLTAEGNDRDMLEFVQLKKGQKIRLEFEVEEEFPSMYLHYLRQKRNLFGCKLISVDWDDDAIIEFVDRLAEITAELKNTIDNVEAIKMDMGSRGALRLGFKPGKI